MKLQKYCLLPAGLMVALVVMSGCPGKGEHVKHEVVVYDWTKADVLAQDESVKNIVVSGDGQHSYVIGQSTVDGLYHSSDLKDWREIKYGEATKTLDPTGGAAIPGKAVMARLNKITSQASTKEGLVISANDSTGGPAYGAVYFKGRNAAAAWANDGSGKHFDGATVNANEELTIGIVNKDSRELIIAIDVAGAGSLGGIGALAASAITASLKDSSGAVFAGGSANGKSFAVVNKDLWFIEGANGLVRVKIDNMATAGNVVAEPSLSAVTDVGGFETFGIAGDNKNENPTQLLSANDKLYISFDTTAVAATKDIDGTGGIVVCTFKPDGDLQACSNNKSWNKIAVRGLAKDADGKVWAVSSEGLLKVEDDGSKGAAFGSTHLALPTDHHAEVSEDQIYQRGALAGTGIRVKAAAFTKEGHLLLGVEQIAGGKNDLYVIRRNTETISHHH